MPSLKLFLASSKRRRSTTSLNLEPKFQSELSDHACAEGSRDRKPNDGRHRRAKLRHSLSDFFVRKTAKKEEETSSDPCSSARAIQRSRSQGGKRLRWASPLVQTSNSDVKLNHGAAIDAATFALAFQRDGEGSRSGPGLRTEVEEDSWCWARTTSGLKQRDDETKWTSVCRKTSG